MIVVLMQRKSDWPEKTTNTLNFESGCVVEQTDFLANLGFNFKIQQKTQLT